MARMKFGSLDPSLLGAFFRVRRQARGMSQEALARSLSVSRRQLGQVETGYSLPSLETFAALCEALDVDPGEALRTTRRKQGS